MLHTARTHAHLELGEEAGLVEICVVCVMCDLYVVEMCVAVVRWCDKFCMCSWSQCTNTHLELEEAGLVEIRVLCVMCDVCC